MKTYEYRGLDAAGRVRKGLVEALSIKHARERLAAEGVLADRLRQSGRKRRFAVDTRAMVYRELSVLLGAGIPMDGALDILIQSAEMVDARSLLAGVRDQVREGSALADALAEASESVTAFEKAIVEAAERSATVESMLERLADFLEDQQRLRERVQAALIYPSIVVGVGICVAILMLGLLVPRAREMMAGSGAALPALTRFMVGLGAVVMRWGLPLLALGAVGGVLFRRRLRHDDALRLRVDRLLFGVPLVGQGYRLLANLRFSRTLAILLQGGVTALDALTMAGRATGSCWVGGLAEKESDTVKHGSRLSDAVARIPPLAASMPGWIRIGEASGNLVRLLESAGKRYQGQWDRFVGRCLSFLEPVLILVIGSFVLLVTLSILLPVLSLTRAIGG